MTRRLFPPLLVLVALVLALAACGGGEESSSTTPAAGGATTGGGGGGGGETLQIAADPSGAFAYDKTDLSATAGKITIDFTNESSVPHNVMIEGDGGTDTITGSETSTTVDLEPGTYTFFCSVDDHRGAGMEGTLVVK